MGVADHTEERKIALLAVDDPVGIENFVTAVLGVDLREHDQQEDHAPPLHKELFFGIFLSSVLVQLMVLAIY